MLWPVFIAVPLIAFLYACVGFGGATGYLAAMSFFDIPPRVMASTALLLNILVSGISFSAFYRAGHLRRELLIPFLLTSVPAAFAGGYFKISDEIYAILLYAVLTFVAIRLLFFSRAGEDTLPQRRLPLGAALGLGLGIGLLSGMVGIGGGIFLSPVILLARWGNAKQASAVAAAFIFLNSASGLAGRLISATFVVDSFAWGLIPLALAGGILGSSWGVLRFSGLALRRLLGVVMTFAVCNFWWGLWK